MSKVRRKITKYEIILCVLVLAVIVAGLLLPRDSPEDGHSRAQGVCGAVNPDPVLVSHIVLPSKGDGGRLNGRPPSPLRILLGSGQRTP